MSPIVIRHATDQDYDEICSLFQALDDYHVFVDPETFQRFPGPPRPLELLKSFLEHPEKALVVAVEGNSMVGFLNCQLSTTPSLPMLRPRTFATVDNIFVVPSHRNRGIGARLVDEAKSWARQKGVEALQLTVYCSNRMAMEFYEKLGFVDVKKTMELRF